MTGPHAAGRDWTVTVVCVIAILAAFYVLVQVGVPSEILVLSLLGACLAACGWMLIVAHRTREKVAAALRALEMGKGAHHD